MEKGQARKQLEIMKKYSKMIRALQEQIETERSLLTDTAIHYKDINVRSGGGSYDAIGDKTPDIVMLCSELESYIDTLSGIKRDVLRVIKTMESDHQLAIMYYYMQDKTKEQTAELMDISYQWLCKILNDAVEEFEKRYDS